jgi:hypothetical protein
MKEGGRKGRKDGRKQRRKKGLAVAVVVVERKWKTGTTGLPFIYEGKEGMRKERKEGSEVCVGLLYTH